MNCPSEEILALHACGDAPNAAVEQHLAACEHCSQLAAAFQADAELFRAAAIEQFVPARTRRRRVPRWPWLAAAAAAAAMVCAIFSHNQDAGRPAPPVHMEGAPPGPLREPLVAQAPRIPRARRRAVKRPQPDIRATEVEGQIVIAKQTADPNVVILLIADEEQKPGETDDK